MARYRYLTILVSVCRDFDEDRSIHVIDSNPLKTIYNLVDDYGKVILETRVVLGYSNMSNYTEYVLDKSKYRTCYVMKKYHLKLPKPMVRDEAVQYIEEITGIKTPTSKDDEYMRLLEKLYEKLGRW